MRTFVLVLLALAAFGDETSRLKAIVDRFRSPSCHVREDASHQARKEVRRLLRPLFDALEDEDPEVRRRARAALDVFEEHVVLPPRPGNVASWHAWQATGEPNAVPGRDDPHAWASKSGNMGRQWLELGYRLAQRVHTFRIFEVNSAGAVVEIQTVDDKGVRRTVWRGEDPTKKPGVFEVKIPATKHRVKLVRILLDTNRRNGWNEIDAVEIVGPKTRAWAVSAAASSSYADR